MWCLVCCCYSLPTMSGPSFLYGRFVWSPVLGLLCRLDASPGNIARGFPVAWLFMLSGSSLLSVIGRAPHRNLMPLNVPAAPPPTCLCTRFGLWTVGAHGSCDAVGPHAHVPAASPPPGRVPVQHRRVLPRGARLFILSWLSQSSVRSPVWERPSTTYGEVSGITRAIPHLVLIVYCADASLCASVKPCTPRMV